MDPNNTKSELLLPQEFIYIRETQEIIQDAISRDDRTDSVKSELLLSQDLNFLNQETQDIQDAMYRDDRLLDFGDVEFGEADTTLREYTEGCHSTQKTQGIIPDQVSPTGNLPSLEEFTGPYNFDFQLKNCASSRNSWVFSSKLNRVFINMHKVLMVQFQISEVIPGMYIRALPVFSQTDYVGVPVIRCTVHAVEDDPLNQSHTPEGECFCTDYKLAGHVVRIQTKNAIYSYDYRSERHSVKVPVINPQAGSQFFDVPYTFACKTSCPRGMQRRPIHVVFTLENSNNEVLGRKILAMKICSCPKRDRDRLEKDYQGEDKPQGKRFKPSLEFPAIKFESVPTGNVQAERSEEVKEILKEIEVDMITLKARQVEQFAMFESIEQKYKRIYTLLNNTY